MLWILLTLIAAFLWGLSNIVDSILVKKYIKNCKVMALAVAFLQPLFFLLIFSIYGIDLHVSSILLLPVLSGIIYLIGGVFYYHSIQIEEVSRMIPIMVSSPLIVALLSALFLDEIFGPIKYIGILIIVLGSFFISFRKKFGTIHFSKGTLFMFLTVLLFGSNTVLIKYGLGFMDYLTFIFWSELGLFLAGFGLLTNKSLRNDFIIFFKRRKKNIIAGVFLKEFLDVSALFTYMVALSIGFASLVSAIGSTQALFAIFFSLLLTIFYPKIMKEEFTKKMIVLKILSTLLIILGVYLIVI